MALRIVILVSLSKLCPAFCKKCLYNGRFVFVLFSVRCSVSLFRRGLDVCPMYWLPLVHLVHSNR